MSIGLRFTWFKLSELVLGVRVSSTLAIILHTSVLQTLTVTDCRSQVYLAKDLETGEMVAVKQIKTRYLTDEDIEGLDSEISVMKTLDHPHIVKLLDFFATKSHCYVVQEVAM
ncbi:hypothetical protein SARC_04140, partial [Sphaeroforma arctica JP610]